MRALVIILLVFFSHNLLGGEQALFDSANEAYAKENFEVAESFYDSLIDLGFYNKDLLYNIANCYYKMNVTGKAILFYERALKLDPRDEDIAFNLELANLRVVSKIEEKETIHFHNLVNNFLDLISMKGLSYLSIGLIWMSLVFGAIYLFNTTTRIKKLSLFSSFIFLIFFLICIGILLAKDARIQRENEAIVMSTNIYVKSAPDQSSTDLFILHEGVKMKLLDSVNNWYKVQISDGKVGWIEESNIEKI